MCVSGVYNLIWGEGGGLICGVRGIKELEIQASVEGKVEHWIGGMGSVKVVFNGTKKVISGRVVEEATIGIFIISNKDGRCCLRIKDVAETICFSISGEEEREKLLPV